jgi:putative SOS response-associated peptidase YedK
MCGRYKLTVPFRELVRLYNLTKTNTSRFDNMQPRYNIAPTQDVPVVRLDRDGQREFVMLRWGLIPYWAKDLKIAFSTINAMAEKSPHRTKRQLTSLIVTNLAMPNENSRIYASRK